MYFGANVLHALVTHPELLAPLRADRARIGTFLNEVLRLSGPPQRLFRRVRRDVEIGGKAIRAGEWVALFFAAANHDPEVFPDPTTLRLDRPNAGDHLTYGTGIHYCLGGPLATLEIARLVAALLDRYAAILPGAHPPVPQTTTLLQHSYVRVPVILRGKD
jgi:cytochrome P450